MTGTAAAPAEAKTLDSLRAELALQGFALVRTTDDRGRPAFVVSRWAMTRQLDSIGAVQDFLRQVSQGAAA